MKRFDSFKTSNKEAGASRYIPYSHLLSPSIIELDNGMLMSVIQLDGIPFQTELNEDLNYFHMIWHQFLLQLDDKFCAYLSMHRKSIDPVLTSHFENKFTKKLDAKYMAPFYETNLFENKIYLSIIYRGIHSGKIGKSIGLMNKVSQKFIKEARQSSIKNKKIILTNIVNQAIFLLKNFKPIILGSKDKELGYSQLLKYLSEIINGGEELSLNNLNYYPPIATNINNTKQQFELYPDGNISQYLVFRRISFRECVQYSDALGSKRFAAILSIKNYPDFSSSVILNPLMQLDVEWVSTQSYASESKEELFKKIKIHSNKLRNVNDYAQSQISQLDELLENLQSNKITMGSHHHTLLIYASNEIKLDENINKVMRCLIESGFSVIKETIGMEPAFWAQLPGNLKYIARSSLVTSENFADFCPLHNYPIGYKNKNHLGGAVTLLKTIAQTPYFFNFHLPGSKDSPSAGHTLILGSNGSGKTVLLTFLDAQVSRYQGTSIFFDRNRGVEIYIRAVGGSYSILSPDNQQETKFNPFTLKDTPGNRKFCCDWMSQLCRTDSSIDIDSDSKEQLKNCVDYAYEHLEPEYRFLSNAVSLLSINFNYWPELRRWIGEEGEYSYLFDNQADVLKLKKTVGFDMTHFLDNEPLLIRTAVLMYLFHWIKQQLTGQLVAIYLDEAWQYFNDSYWKNELKKIIPTFRKLNAFLVMATQSPATIVESDMSAILLDNCSTKIIFPNPSGKKQYYTDGLAMTEAEYLFIKNNPVNCHKFLVKQLEQSVICQLDLSHMKNYVAVLSANEKNVRELDKLRKENRDNVESWLEYFLGESL